MALSDLQAAEAAIHARRRAQDGIHQRHKVWAKDKKGFWGQASVIGYEAATEAPGGSSGSSPVKARARITFKGFSAKFDEWINVGAGCARARKRMRHLFCLQSSELSLSLSLVCVCVLPPPWTQ